MTDRYVSPSGANTGAGTVGAPWLTLAYAFTHLALNDKLILRAGTYAPTGFLGGGNAAAAGCTVEPYPGETATISGASGNLSQFENWSNMTWNAKAGGGQIRFVGTSGSGTPGNTSGLFIYYQPAGAGARPDNIVIDGLVVLGVNGYGIHIGHTNGDSTLTTSGPSNVEILNCDISLCAVGIRFRHSGLGNEVHHNTIHDLNRLITNSVTPTNDDNGAVGIELSGCQATGASKAAPSVWVHHNTIYNCYAPSNDYGWDGGTIEIFQSAYLLIEDNIGHDNEIFIETGTAYPTTMKCIGNVIRRNVVYGTFARNGLGCAILLRAAEDNDVYHNTFDVDQSYDVFRIQEATGGYFGTLQNLKVKNNIIVSRMAGNRAMVTNKASFTATGVEIDYNLLYNSTGSSANVAAAFNTNYTPAQLAAYRAATPFGDHDIWGSDPLWTNRATRDYTLGTGSPAIDAALVIAGTNDGYLGAGPDMGVYEYTPIANPQLAYDSGSRTVVNGLGSADIGGVWTNIGTAADLDVDGTKITTQHAATNASRGGVLANNVEDVTVAAKFQVTVAPVGGAAIMQLIVRWIDASNYIRYNAKINPNGTVTGQYQKVIAGVVTALDSDTASGLTGIGANTWVWVRNEINGTSSSAQLRGRIWLDGSAEPTTWLNSVSLASPADNAVLVPGAFGFRNNMSTGSTSIPCEIDTDEFEATDLTPPPPAAFVATSAGVSGITSGTAILSTSIRFVAASAGDSTTAGTLGSSVALAGTSAGLSTSAAALGALLIPAALVGASAGASTSFGRLTSIVDTEQVPIEVMLYDASATTRLAILDGVREPSWYDPLNDRGTGRFLISRSDAKAALIAKGMAILFYLHGVARYAMVVESRNLTVAASSGASGEFFEVTGRGAEALLAKARQAPGATNYGTLPAAGVIVNAVAAARSGSRAVLPSSLVLDFTAAVDSAGLPWLDAAAYNIDAGTDYLSLLRVLTDQGIDVVMTPGLHLKAYRDGYGTDRTLQVVFREGAHTRGQVQLPEQGTQRITRVWVEGKAVTTVQVFGDETDPNVGIREGYIKVDTTDEPAALSAIGQAAIDASALASQAIKLPLLHGSTTGQYEPYMDYGKGDTIKVDLPDVLENSPARIMAVTIAGQDDGTYTVDVDLNSIYYEELTRLKRQLDRVA